MVLSARASSCATWRLIAVILLALVHIAIGISETTKLPELPRLSKRQLLREHNRLRKLSKILRPKVPIDFHDLTSEEVQVVDVDYGETHPLDRRKAQQTDDEGRPVEYIQYPVGVNEPHTPMRFVFVTDPLIKRKGQSDAMDQDIDNIINNVIPEIEQAWDAYVGVIAIPRTLPLYQGYCFGFFASVLAPQNDYKDVDHIMIVSAFDTLTSGSGKTYDVCSNRNTLVVGSHCAVEIYGRPIVSFLNFCLNNTNSNRRRRLQAQQIDPELSDAWRTNAPISDESVGFDNQDVLAASIHQVGHILGMQFDLWKTFRNSTTAIRFTPKPVARRSVNCTDGSIRVVPFPAANTIQVTTAADGLITYAFSLPITRTVVRNHFNCPSLNGALLEVDPSTPSCVASHWNERVFFGELMQRLAYGTYSAISPLTLSLLYDSFWYLPFYVGRRLDYATAAGCEFANGANCIVNDTVPDYGKGFYCTSPIKVESNGTISLDKNDILCDPLHRKWALCDLYNMSQVPSGFIPSGIVSGSKGRRWFSDRNLVSTTPEVDFCPMPIIALQADCNDSSTSLGLHYQGEVYGENSRCINAALKSKRRVPACFQVKCDANSSRLIVNGITCKYDGETHSIKTVNNQTASFECPRFATICPELASCPSDCSGFGICNYNVTPPQCICTNNVTTPNCQDPEANTPAPTTTRRVSPTRPPITAPTAKSAAISLSLGLSTLAGALATVITDVW